MVLFVCWSAAGVAQQREPGKGVNFYSIESEIAVARQLAAEFQSHAKTLDSQAALSYINNIG